MPKEYKQLSVGDVRQTHDEVRSRYPLTDGKTHINDATMLFRPCLLINHTILASDLMMAEFRRPL